MDYNGMIECYHTEILFKDEIFNLYGEQAGAMWHMLCESSNDLQISFGNIITDEYSGSAYWEAKYTFVRTKRNMHNLIRAHFDFRDEKIIRHVDCFNFWHWSRQALGITGLLLGWSYFKKNKY